MFDAIRNFFADLTPDADNPNPPPPMDKKLAAAALMVQVIAADGKISSQEQAKLNSVLRENYAVSDDEARQLAENARSAQKSAVDLYGFTSILKDQMSQEERLGLVEDLWEMVYADGEIHEFEDNVVWRVAELIGVQSRNRMELKQRVLARRGE